MSGYDNDVPSTMLNFLVFLIPFLGLIFFQLYAVSAPNKARSIRLFTIGGFVAWIVAGLVFTHSVLSV